MNDRETPNTSPALERIRDKGDVLDAAGLYKGHRGLGHAAIWQGFGPLVPLAANGMNSGIEAAATYPVYAAGLGIMAGGTYAASRLKSRLGVSRGETHQQMVRDFLDEPVDIIRTNKQQDGSLKRRAHELALRWYGVDGALGARGRLESVQRLQKIAKYCDTEDIEKIMIGADWIRDVVGTKPRETEFGELHSGRDFLDHYKRGRVSVVDSKADKHMLVSSPEQIASLIKKIEIEDEENRITRLVGLTKNNVVSSSYTSLRANQLTQTEFNDIVRTALERAYEVDDSASMRRVHIPTRVGYEYEKGVDQTTGLPIKKIDEATGLPKLKIEGGVPGRVRTMSSVSVRGEYLHEMAGWNDERTGDARISHEGTSKLLRSHGAETLDQLLSRLSHDENINEKAVLSALYLVLHESESGVHLLTTVPPNSKAKIDSEVRGTLFERMRDEGRLKSRVHRPRREREGSVERKYKRGRVKRGLGAAAVMLVVVGVGGGAGLANAEGYTRSYNHGVSGYEEAMNSGKAERLGSEQLDEELYKYAGTTFEQQYLKANMEMAGKDFNLSTYMAQKFIDIVGVGTVTDIAPGLADSVNSGWRSKAILRLPPEMYTGANGESFIGDAGVGKNQTIYTVKSLTGMPTEGYWYGMVSSAMFPDETGLRFRGLNNGTISAAEGQEYGPTRVSVPADEASIQAQKPDFMVRTPYLLGSNTDFSQDPITLPIMQGTEIVGLRISDRSNPSKFIGAPISEYKLSGISLVEVDPEVVFKAGIKDPQLEYWIKQTKSGEPTVHNMGEMQGYDADIAAVAQTVKKALGLPVNATDDQLMSAIRDSKYYSFTPFADEHTELKIDISQTTTEALSEVGTVLAKMDALNCNLASALYLLGQGRNQIGEAPDPKSAQLNLATGFHDDGDGNLTSREAHAWLLDKNDKVVDPTPGKSRNPLPSMAPEVEERQTEGESGNLTGIVSEAMLGAALMVVAYRRRKQIAKQVANDVLAMKKTPEAIAAIQTALYGGQGTRLSAPRSMSLDEARKAIVRNVPLNESKRGIPLDEVERLLHEKGIDANLSSVRTRLAIYALYLSDGIIRASAGVNSPRSGRK